MTCQVPPSPEPITAPAQQARYALVAALYKQQLGQIIRQRREESGLTQSQLALRAHVGESTTVSRWERGLNAPTDLEAVAAALDTTPGEMLSELSPHARREHEPVSREDQLDRIEQRLESIETLLAGRINQTEQWRGVAGAALVELARTGEGSRTLEHALRALEQAGDTKPA